MSFNDVVKRVSEVCPKFNDYALRKSIQETIDGAPEFVKIVFQEAFKLVNADLEFINYEVMGPEETVRHALSIGGNRADAVKIPMTVSHFRLVKYNIRFQDRYFDVKLYTPYLYDDMLYINGKRSVVRKVIVEKTIARVQEKAKDGISVSPIRINIMFNRQNTYRVVSYLTGDVYNHFIVSSKLYGGKMPKKVCETTIVHYMLAKFGYDKTLKKFGIQKSDLSFTTEVGDDTEKYDYFSANSVKHGQDSEPLFLRVNRTLLMDDHTRKFVINVLYVLHHSFGIQSINNVYDENGDVWKIILGMIISSDRAVLKAKQQVDTHFRSVDTFIDPVTRERFNHFGIPINDIYDLLVYVFNNIDSFMTDYVSQDIYNSRIDVSNGVLINSFAYNINTRAYRLAKKTNISFEDVRSDFSISPIEFERTLSSKKDDAENYTAPPDIIGDNFLFSGGLNKIRIGGKAEQRFHPSMAVVESINAFVGKYIGKTGYINPFVPTDKYGSIVHPDYAEDIDSIISYLPR